jgi:hypothetical protein
MKKAHVSFWLILLFVTPGYAQHDLQISLKNNTDKELQSKNQLERILNKYNLSKWLFTKKVLIDEKTSIPHSHPVLTLNTSPTDDLGLLATFVHEQIHWFEESKPQQRDKAIEELKTIYPDAPGGPPEGARDKYSTYLHLMVCYLEHEAMIELAGKEKADEVIKSKRYYRWIYRTVLSDGPKIKAVIDKHKVNI